MYVVIQNHYNIIGWFVVYYFTPNWEFFTYAETSLMPVKDFKT
jgi:hypothetical protein